MAKQSFTDVDLNQITSEHLQNLFKHMGIKSDGDIDEKLIEDKAAVGGDTL